MLYITVCVNCILSKFISVIAASVYVQCCVYSNMPTNAELACQLSALQELIKLMPTKDDLKVLATKKDLENIVTKDDLEVFKALLCMYTDLYTCTQVSMHVHWSLCMYTGLNACTLVSMHVH